MKDHACRIDESLRFKPVNVALLTVSDTRDVESDTSGALLADLIPSGQRQDTGLYFGIWAMLGKLALALSAGLALPLLHGLGYVPGSPAAAGALAMIYAGVPCVLKLFNGLLLFGWSPAFRPQSLPEPTP